MGYLVINRSRPYPVLKPSKLSNSPICSGQSGGWRWILVLPVREKMPGTIVKRQQKLAGWNFGRPDVLYAAFASRRNHCYAPSWPGASAGPPSGCNQKGQEVPHNLCLSSLLAHRDYCKEIFATWECPGLPQDDVQSPLQPPDSLGWRFGWPRRSNVRMTLTYRHFVGPTWVGSRCTGLNHRLMQTWELMT